MSKANHEYFGNYILLERLASGGMAEVFLARSPGTGGISKNLAIKRILPQYSDNQDFIDMFTSEAKIAVNLSHSNVVSIHEFGIQNKQLYLCMEYVEGKNLRQLTNHLKKQGKKLSIDQIVYVIKEVASGLDHAHRCIDGSTGKPLNIIHRDISPQNVMINYEGEVKVVDFGIAKAESQVEKTKAGTLKGKFGYMSPEQAQGLEVDIRTDIFSLGTVLWELLANQRLFTANNEINTLRKIRDCNIPNIKQINPNVHDDLAFIVNKSLTKDRNQRYQYSSELSKDLNRFLNRQYPDFSKQDFSKFISGACAQEIVEIRNRIIEYSKIQMKSGEEEVEEKDNDLLELITSTDFNTPEESLKVEREPIVPREKIDFSNYKLKNEAPIQVEKPKARPKTVTKINHSYSTNSVRRVRSKRPRKSKLTPALLTLMLIFGVSLHFSEQIDNPMLTKVKAKMVSMFNDKKMELGSLSDEKSQENLEKNITEKNQLIDPQTEINEKNKPLPKKINYIDIVVNSRPSGARVFVNNNDTKKSTPTRLKVPFNEEFNLKIKKKTYIPYIKTLTINNQTKRKSINATLQKDSSAYLNIRASASENLQIFVNNERLDERLPIQYYAIPSNRVITIRAYNPYSKAKKTISINLKPNQQKTIFFDFSNQRVPSKQNN